MSISFLSGQSFGVADYGVTWAMFQLPEPSVRNDQFFTGQMAVRVGPLRPKPKNAGEDDYAIRFEGTKAVNVLADSAVGAIAAMLRLGAMLTGAEPRRNAAHAFPFRARNYKHEIKFEPDAPRSILKYTDQTWETLCRQIVGYQFNGLTLYPGAEHPFEQFLDYSGLPEVVTRPANERAAVRAALNRGMAIAHRYGLKTFMQHYVGHFPEKLSEAFNIPSIGRLSSVDHPEVERYCRYCYHEVFRQVPDLDGLYFNFESYHNAWQHLLNTAIPEMNKLRKKPIMVCRTWCFDDPEGMKKMMKAYKGRVILSQKGTDTNDTYYLPEPDTRVLDWKKYLGKDTEFMHCIGPCHNCGTSLCNQLWGDYEYMAAWLKKAKALGDDSISFHTVNELFSVDLEDPKGVFGQHEKNMSRFNFMHVQAVVDFFNGVKRTPAQQAAMLVQRAGVPTKAGKALLDAIEASSQLILLAYQQFCFGSTQDGYMNRGRYSHIQEPFFFYTATQHNHQSKAFLWSFKRSDPSWLNKIVDTKITPDNFLQYIIDYVNPSKPKAKRNPAKVALLLDQNMKAAQKALAAYKKAAGAEAAAALEPYIKQNALTGEYVRQEILAAIELYKLYFAKTKPAMLQAVRKGIKHLEQLAPLVADRNAQSYHIMNRVTLLSPGLNPDHETSEARQFLEMLQKTDFPVPAWRDYIESRRLYNEIRRELRPNRWLDHKAMEYARKLLKASLAKAQKSVKALDKPSFAALKANVQAWLEYVQFELDHTVPPKAKVPAGMPQDFMPMRHEDCFRSGENFVEDFTGFFKSFDYMRNSGLGVRVWQTPTALAVTLREQMVNVQERKDRWQRFRAEGSTSHSFRIGVDVQNKGKKRHMFIVFPPDGAVLDVRTPRTDIKTEFSEDENSWQITAYIPFADLGKKPKRGEVWGLNVSGNPAVGKNKCYTWAPAYDDLGAGNPILFGKIKFE